VKIILNADEKELHAIKMHCVFVNVLDLNKISPATDKDKTSLTLIQQENNT